MILSNKNGVQHIVAALAELGLREVIITPGSRNAPLVLSFNRHKNFCCTSIKDERSAAFFALGKAIELKQPVAVLCTSGTAALNFSPAIAEAYYQKIPLIVLTTDRPKEWINQGDGQTIHQSNIYKNFIQKSYDINGDAETENDIWYIERCLSEGFSIATNTQKGPVHFNIFLNEPLYQTLEVNHIKTKVFKTEKLNYHLPELTLEKFIKQFSESKKVMILIGQHFLHKPLNILLSNLAQFENVVVLTESTSNMHHPLFIENIDRCITGLSEENLKELSPDLLITYGGAIVSKRIKTLLRKHKPALHWNIDEYDATMDTYQCLTNAIQTSAYNFLEQFCTDSLQPTQSNYQTKWQALQQLKKELHQTFCNEAAYSDFLVFKKIFENCSSNISLHIGNSSPIRYAQLFDNSHIIETWSNRGTSGIDGCSSTAMGAAVASPNKQFVLITGDVSFYYDINAFWNEQEINNLNVILINNSGGGIFRIIEGPNSIEERSEFLETAMQSSAENIAKHFQWNYLSIKNENELDEKLKIFFSSSTKKSILEIFTDAAINPVVLEMYWKFLNK